MKAMKKLKESVKLMERQFPNINIEKKSVRIVHSMVGQLNTTNDTTKIYYFLRLRRKVLSKINNIFELYSFQSVIYR